MVSSKLLKAVESNGRFLGVGGRDKAMAELQKDYSGDEQGGLNQGEMWQ